MALTYIDNHPNSGAPRLTCDMDANCTAEVTHLDREGYVYCAHHAIQRKQAQSCRKLLPAERRKLLRGERVIRY